MTRPLKILIVEDEPLNVDVLEQYLAELGYRTENAGNGKTALKRVAASPPDLILLDMMMPVVDGLTTCRLLKQNQETRHIPVVIMTAMGEIMDRSKGMQAGASAFLTKPFDEVALREVIEAALKEPRAPISLSHSHDELDEQG